ncbi:MAG: PRC-barrel domain-containing protein, partial [Deltaproteobacteria bacterium]|nr:PRC-barrel domain-containing protein [Deltaproteobacteria bacterium]
ETDLLGFNVYSRDGDYLGKVESFLTPHSQTLLQFRDSSGREIYVPWLEEFIYDLDLEGQRITLENIPGLLD